MSYKHRRNCSTESTKCSTTPTSPTAQESRLPVKKPCWFTCAAVGLRNGAPVIVCAWRNFGCNIGAYINVVDGISMGDYFLIGSNVTISSGVHPIDGRFPPIFARPALPKPIVIEDDVWVGAGAVIMPGVTLRRGTVVRANTVVTNDTYQYGVYVGAPARKLRSRVS